MDATMASMSRSSPPAGVGGDPLGEPALRGWVERYLRGRVPPSDVDDVVQTVLCAAVAARRVPEDEEQLRRWLIGIARHKVADLHRHRARAKEVELKDHDWAAPAPLEARELARWAEEQIPDAPEAKRTLAWMAREGAGEKLAHIAAEDQVPADRVRQRVSRMRRFMRRRWQAELAAVAVTIGAVILAWALVRPTEPVATPIHPEPLHHDGDRDGEVASPIERAELLREQALRECEHAHWELCVRGLDEAARLDPAGDTAPSVREARRRAAETLSPPPETPPVAPPDEPSPSEPVPTSSASATRPAPPTTTRAPSWLPSLPGAEPSAPSTTGPAPMRTPPPTPPRPTGTSGHSSTTAGGPSQP